MQAKIKETGTEIISADIIIIGGGLSGLTCAYRLQSLKGMKTIVLARGTGASPDITGFSIPLHETDSKDLFMQDTIASGQGQSDLNLVQALCEDSLNVLPLLEEIGFQLDKDIDGKLLFRRPLGASAPRVVGQGNRTGAVIMNMLHKKIRAGENIVFYNAAHALRLLCDKSGRLSGVLVYDASRGCLVQIIARAIVLACGGFCKIFPFSTNSPDIGGDGIAMAYEAGLPLIDLEFVQFEPSAAVYPDEIRGKGVITTMMYEGAVLRNVHGERFMLRYDPAGEKVNKDTMALRVYKEISMGNGTVHGGVFFDATEVDPKRLSTVYDIFVERYKRCGIDISREPMEVAPAPHTSLGGVEASPDCSTAMKGFFVCGEAMGALHGANRIGGNAGLETLVFGSRAASAVANYLQTIGGKDRHDHFDAKSSFEEITAGNSGHSKLNAEEIGKIRHEMGTWLNKSLNVVRNGPDMEKAAEIFSGKLESLQAMNVDSDSGLFEKIRLENDLRTAQLLAISALERKESIGCHNRADSLSAQGRSYKVRIHKKKDKPVIEKVFLKN